MWIGSLQWSVELAEYAQNGQTIWLQRAVLMQHRPIAGMGAKVCENIFWGSASSYTPLDASESWYGEIKDYKYGVVTMDNNYPTGITRKWFGRIQPCGRWCSNLCRWWDY
jgi:hypothetical protein